MQTNVLLLKTVRHVAARGQREREYHSAVTHRQSAQSTHVAHRAEHSTLEDLRACTTNTHVALRQGRRAEQLPGLGRKCQ